ncbi:hypothetical protein ISCGN_004799 [Ixodes scapularis]
MSHCRLLPQSGVSWVRNTLDEMSGQLAIRVTSVDETFVLTKRATDQRDQYQLQHLCSVKVHVYAGTISEAAQHHLKHGTGTTSLKAALRCAAHLCSVKVHFYAGTICKQHSIIQHGTGTTSFKAAFRCAAQPK